MDTVLRSPQQTVLIGPNRPFVIIGERINPTGRKALAAEMAAGDFSRVIADAKAQVEAGAHVLDVNSGVPLTDEAEIMAEAIRLVQATVDVPLCIDSSVVGALEAGLKATVNSDAPAYFGGYVNDNFRAVAAGLGLTRAEIAALARNSFTGSWLTTAEAAPHLAALDAYEAGFSG